MDAGDGAGGTIATPIADPPPKRPRRRLFVGLIAGAVVLAAGIAAVFLIPPVSSSPTAAPESASAGTTPVDVVRDYLSLLESGDAASASLLLDPGVSGADAELLTDVVLAGAEQRIRAVAVEAVEEGSGSASVRATLSLDGEQFDHVFTLAADAGGWTLDEPLVTAVRLESEAAVVQVGGVDVAVGPAGRTLYLYPGVYTVTGAGGGYLAASTERILVTTPSSRPIEVSIAADPTDSYRSAVLAQVQDRIAHCTEVPGNMDRECPRITIDTKLSELSVTMQADGLETFSATHFVSGYAEITVRSVATDANPNPSPRSQRFRMKGSIEVHDGIPQIVAVTSF